jgi:hypothetical protein
VSPKQCQKAFTGVFRLLGEYVDWKAEHDEVVRSLKALHGIGRDYTVPANLVGDAYNACRAAPDLVRELEKDVNKGDKGMRSLRKKLPPWTRPSEKRDPRGSRSKRSREHGDARLDELMKPGSFPESRIG